MTSSVLNKLIMICILIGVVPPLKSVLGHVQNRISEIDGKKIDWHDSTIAKDADDNDKPTLILSAVGDFSPDEILCAVNTEVRQFLSEISERNDNMENEIPPRCEIWASAPCPLPLMPEGLSLLVEKNEESNWLKTATATFQEWGLLMQSSMLNADEIAELRCLVDKAITETHQIISNFRPNMKLGQDVFSFKEIASRSKERFDLRLLETDAIRFVERHVMKRLDVAALLEEVLGSVEGLDFDLSVVYSRPGAEYQGWHADGQHISGAMDAGWSRNGWKFDLASAYAVCLFIPLIDLNEEVGYTQFWPGTHRYRGLVGFGKVGEIAGSTYNGICNAGDAIWYDYRCLHRGMPNFSTVLRPVVQIIFKKSWYMEKRNYGTESVVPGNSGFA